MTYIHIHTFVGRIMSNINVDISCDAHSPSKSDH